jgi:hypothetical protein
VHAGGANGANTGGMPDEFVPEADAIEQELPVREPDSEETVVDLGAEVPEADATEQALPGPILDEDEPPR